MHRRRPLSGALMQYRWSHLVGGGRHEWVLRRNCALSPGQFGACMAGLGAVSVAIAALFAWQGAWLILPFSCIELTGLALAFVVYGRHATDYEKIVAGEGVLAVESVHAGSCTRVEHDAQWLRVVYRGARRGEPVLLVTGSQSLAIGRYVPDECRARLADEMRDALRQGWSVRAGGRRRPETAENGFD